MAVHGQSDQHRLLRPAAQRDALDRFGGEPVAGAAGGATPTLHARLTAAERELDRGRRRSARERAREADLLRFGLDEIEAVEPQPGEDDELRAEEARLGLRRHPAHRRRAGARGAVRRARAAPTPWPPPPAARTAARGRPRPRPRGRRAGRPAGRVTYLLSDLAADVASYASRLDADPARLAAVSERRAALTALTRKYGETIDEVLAWAEQAVAPAARPRRHRRADRASCAASRSRLRAELADGRRAPVRGPHRRAPPGWPTQVTAELTLLAMPHARLDDRRSARPRPPTPDAAARRPAAGRRRAGCGSRPAGVDEVEFLLAANTGAEPRPLHKGASGGELSRVMLALEVALAGTSPVPTFVFDEVDAGVGGKAAVEVGRRLARLARTAQVLVVTHLPQVAAFADRHVVVEKSSDGTVTSSGLTVLDDGRPGARAVPDAGRHGRVRHRPGPRPRAARRRPARPRPGLTRASAAADAPGPACGRAAGRRLDSMGRS